MLISEAQEHITNVKPIKINTDAVFDVLNSRRKQTLQLINQHRNRILSAFDLLQSTVEIFFSCAKDQITSKSCNPQKQLEQSILSVCNAASNVQYTSAISKIINMISSKEDSMKQVTEIQLISGINNAVDDIIASSTKKIQLLSKEIQAFSQEAQKHISVLNIWKSPSYKFSDVYKHPDIKILSPTVVKSVNGSGYKFAIMQPSIEGGVLVKKVAFKVKASSSNWVAFGICHKKIVQSKSYGFNFGSVGHGGYMISANGGSWSNTKPELNNNVKVINIFIQAFKFIKGDLVNMTINLITKVLTFKKDMETYELPFDTIKDDQLHLCVLFYYVNDEIQFFPKQIETQTL